MKDLESQARVIQGGLVPDPNLPASPPVPESPLDVSSDLSQLGSARGAARAYHTNIRMLGLKELALSGLIPQVADARAQGPSDALVMAVRTIRESGGAARRSLGEGGEKPSTDSAMTRPGHTSFKKMLSRRINLSLEPGEVPDGT